MGRHRLLILAVLCVSRHAVKGEDYKDLATSDEAKGTESIEGGVQRKRDLSIVGPIPSSYRGQATGKTTYDGIQTGDLQLPNDDVSGFRRESHPLEGGFLRFEDEQLKPSFPSTGFRGFAAESASDVYNFDGKEPVTYDGVLASDLTIPLPHITRTSSDRHLGPFALPRTGETNGETPASHLAEPTSDSVSPEGLTLPSVFTVQQVFNAPNIPKPLDLQPQLRDTTLCQAETPTERYNCLHEQYQATLEEYRNSLARFQQLHKYTKL